MAGQVKVTITDKEWLAGLANTPWEQVQGLGGITGIAPGTGMLFDLGYEQAITVTTEPMLFHLDIAFFSEALEVTEVYQNVAPGYHVYSTLPARYFLEVNAGELESVEAENQAVVELLALQPSSSGPPDWVFAMTGFMGFMIMAMLAASLLMDQVKKPVNKPPGSPLLLAQTQSRKEYRIRMDRLGNIIITHEKEPGKSVFLQFEADKELVTELLKPHEKKDLENGWTVKIKDDKPRASVLGEIWQTSSQPDPQTKNETQVLGGTAGLPVARILEKWQKTKARNSTLALRNMETLGPDYDTADCKQALADYQGIERADYGDQEEYQEARDEAWENFLECLESMAGEEEERMAVEKQPSTITGKVPTSKESQLEYLVDSPEYLTQTIEDIGYREKIDDAFLNAIARARGRR
jgi:uncharacterized membrane protein (UPF0127 family)